MFRQIADMLKEMFDPHAVASEMDLDTIARQVGEMRAAEPDNMEYTDAEIAQALQS